MFDSFVLGSSRGIPRHSHPPSAVFPDYLNKFAKSAVGCFNHWDQFPVTPQWRFSPLCLHATWRSAQRQLQARIPIPDSKV